jgi:hypothetical protein
MDCPSEERMIRMKLEGFTNIQSLQFDIPNRKLDVYYMDSYDGILAVLNTLQFDTKFVSSEPTDMENTNDNQSQSLFLNMRFYE